MSRFKVADVMTMGAVSVGEDVTYRQLVDLLESRSVNSLPVVDSHNRVLGVVSATDLMYKMEFAGDADRRRLLESRHHRDHRAKAAGMRAADLMTSPAVTVSARTSVVTAAKLMESTGVKRLPVVDDLGRLIGVATRRDLLKVFFRTDTEICNEVKNEVLPAVLGYQARGIKVDACDGVVTLVGEADERSVVNLAGLAVERLDGVVSVVNRMTYRHDDVELAPTFLTSR